MKKPKVLFVDMDGTLINSEAIWQRIQIDLANELKHDEHETFLESIHGYSIDSIAEAIYAVSNGFSSVNELRNELCRRIVNALPSANAFSDSELFVTVTTRADIRNYVVSNSSKEMMNAALGMKRWVTYVSGIFSAEDDVENQKPAPDIYEYALKTTNLMSRECLAIEDSLSGFQAATSAEIPTVFLNRFNTQINHEIEKKAAFIATDFNELLSKLELKGWLKI